MTIVPTHILSGLYRKKRKEKKANGREKGSCIKAERCKKESDSRRGTNYKIFKSFSNKMWKLFPHSFVVFFLFPHPIPLNLYMKICFHTKLGSGEMTISRNNIQGKILCSEEEEEIPREAIRELNYLCLSVFLGYLFMHFTGWEMNFGDKIKLLWKQSSSDLRPADAAALAFSLCHFPTAYAFELAKGHCEKGLRGIILLPSKIRGSAVWTRVKSLPLCSLARIYIKLKHP